MNPPYEITPKILRLISSISQKVGEINAHLLDRPSTKLRKQNRIRTIHGSLKIEGNTLTQDQVTAIVENKRVIGPEKDILEVRNAIKVYEALSTIEAASTKSFLNAHQILMNGLVDLSGRYRNQAVGIYKGDQISHVAPPPHLVPTLMDKLFDYIKNSEEIPLIKSCVFHYEMEFIHPFLDGNGRMGRLWQTVILMEQFPLFEFLPFETLISKSQQEYYSVLAKCDKAGNSTLFIEYMLTILELALDELLDINSRTMTSEDRLDYYLSKGKTEFSRKDYMNMFKDISSATASRDLRKGLELELLTKEGDKNKTVYKILT